MFSEKSGIYNFAFVLIAFAKLLTCSEHATPTSIDILTQNYLSSERNLWHLVYSTYSHDDDDTLLHVYDTHEEFLGKHFGEMGIFDKLLKQQQNQSIHDKDDEQRRMERHTVRMADNLRYINVTTSNAYQHLNHRQFEQLSIIINEVLENMPKAIATLGKFADFNFWIYVRNVKWSNSDGQLYVLH